jgi:protein-disulfide isomerase
MSISRRDFLSSAAKISLLGLASASVFGASVFAMGKSDDKAADVATKVTNKDMGALAESPDLKDIVLGLPDAPVTVVEYASLTCGHCANFHNNTFPQVKTELIDTGKVRFIQRMYPLDDAALSAAMVARCGGDNLYYPLLDTFYEQQRNWMTGQPMPGIFAIARQAGYTEESFRACLTNQALYDAILAQKNAASEQLGVQSTPTFFFNGKMVSGAMSFEDFSKEVEAIIGS